MSTFVYSRHLFNTKFDIEKVSTVLYYFDFFIASRSKITKQQYVL